jgi:myo-inositol-1(or 4)-monophosphatase
MSDSPFFWQPPIIGALAIQAGINALLMQKTIAGKQKSDKTLVTEADTQTEHFLTHSLQLLHPRALVLGEETWESLAKNAITENLKTDMFILDPIDGTAMYAAGLAGWGVSIGFATEGKLTHGAVFLPGSGELYITTDVTAAYLRLPMDRMGIPIIPAHGESLPDYVASRLAPLEVRHEQPVKLVSVTQYVAKSRSFPTPYVVLSTGSFVVSMLNLAQGSFSACVAKAKIWDMAGAWPVARKLGVKAMMVPSEKPFDGPIQKGPWVWDSQHKSFLGLEEHVLFYRDPELAQTCLKVIQSWEDE